MSRVLFAGMTRTELSGAALDALAVLPVGATEQHGPHLPTGTDTFQVDWIVQRAVKRVSDHLPVVLCPTLPFGSSAHHLPFGGTMSLGTETFRAVMTDLCDSLADVGYRRIFIVNGHGGNHEIVQVVARDVALRRKIAIAAGSWWTIAWEGLVSAGVQKRGPVPGHAGWFESSLGMAMHPEMVSAERSHRDRRSGRSEEVTNRLYRAELPGFWLSTDGVSDSTDAGDAETGRVLLDVAIDALASVLAQFHGEAGPYLDSTSPRITREHRARTGPATEIS